MKMDRIVKKVGARVSLLGNPSDAFFGKTLSCLIGNFDSEVWIEDSRQVRIVPNHRLEPLSFASLSELRNVIRTDGYYGGTRLILATCKVFNDYCEASGLQLPRRNFALGYDTTIPRQVGLAGSSAIVTCALRGLMEFFGLSARDISQAMQATLALNVEADELDIPAGLQDRVVQIYGGLLYMDFGADQMRREGHGTYEKLDLAVLPSLYLAYASSGSESGRAHRPIRARWEQGDTEICQVMEHIAGCAERGKAALLAGDHTAFGRLMDENLQARLRIYGHDVCDERYARTVEMIQIAHNQGLVAQFAGSGGAVVGICAHDKFEPLRREMAAAGFGCCLVAPMEMREDG